MEVKSILLYLATGSQYKDQNIKIKQRGVKDKTTDIKLHKTRNKLEGTYPSVIITREISFAS